MHVIQLKQLVERLNQLTDTLTDNTNNHRYSAAYLNCCQIEQDMAKLRQGLYDRFMHNDGRTTPSQRFWSQR